MLELIDTLWNVNMLPARSGSCFLPELIDTLWNVNVKKLGRIARGVFELIDTLWNVNVKACEEYYVNLRINRYIMECKYIYAHDVGCKNLELIDTLWNVNTIFQHIILLLQFELIDTLWNVNKLVFCIYQFWYTN